MGRRASRFILLSASLLLAAIMAGRDPVLAQYSEPGTRKTTKQTTAKKKEVKKQVTNKKDSSKNPASKGERTWTVGREGANPTLAFGSAGGKEPLLLFVCQPDAGLLRVVAHIGTRGLRPGDGAGVRLSNGRAKFEVAGTVYAIGSKDSVDIGGTTRIDPKLFELLRSGDTMIVEVPGRKTGLPVKDLGPKAEAFEKACTPQR